jgi:hypothetical protein
VLHAAARSDAPLADYKRRFHGEPMNPLTVASNIEGIADGEAPVRIDPTRRFTTLALADELVQRPELLRDYVAGVRPQDDASLLIYAPGLEANGLLALTEAAVAAAGLDIETLPDALLAPLPGSPATYRALAERADAILSDWPAIGPLGKLPRFSGLPVGV